MTKRSCQNTGGQNREENKYRFRDLNLTLSSCELLSSKKLIKHPLLLFFTFEDSNLINCFDESTILESIVNLTFIVPIRSNNCHDKCTCTGNEQGRIHSLYYVVSSRRRKDGQTNREQRIIKKLRMSMACPIPPPFLYPRNQCGRFGRSVSVRNSELLT